MRGSTSTLAQELSVIVTVEVGALVRAGVSRDEAEPGLWNKSTNLFSCLLTSCETPINLLPQPTGCLLIKLGTIFILDS